MTYKNKSGTWLGAVTLVTGMLSSGCGSNTLESVTQELTSLVSQAVTTTADASDAPEVADLMHGLHGLHALHPKAVEGFHCDASPDITHVTVCGKERPATVHLEWTECAAPGKPGGGKGPGGEGPGGGKGPGGEAPAGKGPGGGKGPRFGPSSGTVDIAYTYDAAEDCSGGVTQNQSVTLDISRTDEDGAVSRQQGTTASSALLLADAPPRGKSTQADVTRTLTDASGTLVRSVRLHGSTTTDFSNDTPPVRTLNGAYTEEFLDGTQGTVTLTDIVRPSREVCPWPTSGTLTRASSDTSHSLVFGPECGEATLDGTAVDLSAHRPHEPKPPHAPKRP